MPFLVQLTHDAARDLEEICDYIDQHDAPGRADRVLEQIDKAFHFAPIPWGSAPVLLLGLVPDHEGETFIR